MNATKIKTRHGLILQDLLGTALTQAGFTYRENWQYDPDLERPDFTIPDSDKPKLALEVCWPKAIATSGICRMGLPSNPVTSTLTWRD